jgi:cobalt-zinc-cadmium efflux system outer membrane protein
MFGLSMNLPVFYQQQGEVQRATADVSAQTVQGDRVIAQIANDVTAAFTAFVATKTLLARLEATVLERAKRARDVVDTQYKAGSATLMDFLDAQRTYIATNQQYLQALGDYWSAVFQLEQAVGKELK